MIRISFGMAYLIRRNIPPAVCSLGGQCPCLLGRPWNLWFSFVWLVCAVCAWFASWVVCLLAFTLSWFRLVYFGVSSVYISITNLYLNSLLVTFLGHAPLKGLIIIHLKDLNGMGSAHLNSILSNVKHQPQINVNLFVSVCCLCQKRQCQDIPFPWIFWIQHGIEVSSSPWCWKELENYMSILLLGFLGQILSYKLLVVYQVEYSGKMGTLSFWHGTYKTNAKWIQSHQAFSRLSSLLLSIVGGGV